MRVVDLFAGTGSATQAFRDRGHEVEEVEIARGGDVMTWEPKGHYDLIWASPPCQAFSVAGFWAHHFRDGAPLTETARQGLRLLGRTLDLLARADASYFIIENPRGLMRKLMPANIERRTVWYCQYGAPYAKPTDLFGRFPERFVALSCRNGGSDHESFNDFLLSRTARARVPYGLSLALCIAAELSLAEDGRP